MNEEYDDWYNSEADEFIFEDPKGVLKIIENACNMVHQCVDYELLKEGYELANILLTIAILVEGDYSDFRDETLYMVDLERDELTTYNFRRLVLDALYAAYQSNPLERRPEILYHIICNSECDDITLESMIQEGNEDLKQQEEFLYVWIYFLGEQIVHSIGFTVEDYSKGLSRTFELNDVELFWDLFGRWKKCNVLPEADQEQIINKLDKWIQIRVEGIMQNNHRNYYGECAAFVAAFGEVRDSRGERNGKDNIFEVYRTKYSRRSAFHGEMRAYGMKDRKRT